MAELIVLNRTDKKRDILSEKEKRMAEIIKKSSLSQYADFQKGADWDIFYQFTTFREGLVNWYPFQEKGATLIISSGFGALVGILARRTAKVDVLEENAVRAECMIKRYADVCNVRVLVGAVQDLLKFSYTAYDYIVVEKEAVTKKEVQKMIDIAGRFLSRNGRMLFVCENRFGMRYWCGVSDSLTGEPFGSICAEKSVMRITRSSLIDILQSDRNAGDWRIYYPFPDHRLPQAIYTDEYLPQAGIRDRVIFYYTPQQRNSLVFLEDDICDDLISNGVFQTFANSFLVEYAKTKFQPVVRYAALSTDRGREHGFATMVCAENVVRKKALHPQGRASLKNIFRNQQELDKHGIMCVGQKMFNDFIEMPYVQGPNLIEDLKDLYLKRKIDEIEHIFDLLYDNILNSSVHVSFLKCAIKNKELNEQNAGIILQEAYIDMIPYNCFYKNGNLLFYDQEFVKKDCPAKYVLFRALRYTYFYIKEAEMILALQCFKDKFELNEVWEIFEQEEAAFIEENRNYDSMSSFYKWAEISRSDINANRKRLTSDGEGSADI